MSDKWIEPDMDDVLDQTSVPASEASGWVEPDMGGIDSSGVDDDGYIRLNNAPEQSQEEIGAGESALGSFAQGFGGMISSLPKAIAESSVALDHLWEDDPYLFEKAKTPEESSFYKAGEAVDAYIAENYKINPKYADGFLTGDLPNALGSAAGFMTGGMAGKVLKVPSLLTVGGLGAASGGVGQVDDYKNAMAEQGKDVDPNMRMKAFASGAALGTTEALPIERALGRLDIVTNGGVRGIVKEGFKGGLEELTQEVIQSIGGNMIANELLEYDPERDTFEHTAEAGGLGFSVGFLLNTLAASIGRIRGGKKSTSEPQEKDVTPGADEWKISEGFAVGGETLALPDAPIEVDGQGQAGTRSQRESYEADMQDLGLTPDVRKANANRTPLDVEPELIVESVEEAATPLALPNPERQPMVVYPDGTVARQGQMEAFISDLLNEGKEEDAFALRAQLLGYAPQDKELYDKALRGFTLPENLQDSRLNNAHYRKQMEEFSQVKGKKRNVTSIDPESDTLLEAIAKLGGLDRADAQQQGIDPESFKQTSPIPLKPVFRTQNGLSFDGMAEALSQYGFVSPNYTANELLELVDDSLRGNDVHSNQYMPQEASPFDNSLEGANHDQGTAALRKALDGKKLGKRETRIISNLLDHITGGREKDLQSVLASRAESREFLRSLIAAKYGKGLVTQEDIARLKVPVSLYDIESSGQHFTEEAYTPDMTGEARTLYELFWDASFAGAPDAELDAIMDPNVSESEKARKLFDLLETTKNEGQTKLAVGDSVQEVQGGQSQRVRADDAPTQPEQTRSETGTEETASEEVATEKRSNTKARDLYDKYSKDEVIDKVLRNELTGVKGLRSFVIEVEDATYTAAIDADSLKFINDNLSHEIGDKLLQNVADALVDEFGYDNTYHKSGDEFFILGFRDADAGLIREGMARVEERLKGHVLSVEKDGKVHEATGLTATPGYGKTVEEADNALNQEKLRREKRGERPARGEAPAGYSVRPAERQQAQERDTATDDRPASETPADTPTEPVTSQDQPTETPAPDAGVSASEEHENTEKPLGEDLDNKSAHQYGDENKVFNSDAADKARELLRKKLGNLNNGLDPEVMQAGMTLAGYHIEAGARSFAAYSKAMVDDLGDVVRPFLRSWYEAVRWHPAINGQGMTPAEEIPSQKVIIDGKVSPEHVEAEKTDKQDIQEEETEDYDDDAGSDDNLERDSKDAKNKERVDEEAVSSGRGRTDGGSGKSSRPSDQAGTRQQGDTGLSGTSSPVDGESGNFSLFGEDGEFRVASSPARDPKPSGSRKPGSAGVSTEPKAIEVALDAAAESERQLTDKKAAQEAANDLPVVYGDEANIRKTLPYLMPKQQDDVLKAETRYKAGKHGILFTNGTGTGKTYTGLGTVNRHIRESGDDNVLILVPTDPKAKDWIEDGENLDLDITQLKDKKDAGTGIVVTTFANFRDNWELQSRDFSMVVYDESHYLGQSQERNKKTGSLIAHRAITGHDFGYRDRVEFRDPEAKEMEYKRREFVKQYIADETAKDKERAKNDRDGIADVPDRETLAGLGNKEFYAQNQELMQALNNRLYDEARELEAHPPERSKVVFLSASPFAYHFSLAYGEGYLFDIARRRDDEGMLAYNEGDPMESFYIQNFGYRMRYNKLTTPDREVNVDLMEREFHERLKNEGSVSGRQLDVPFDYSRQFIELDSKIGRKVDEGLNVLRGFTAEGDYLSEDEMLEKGLPYFRNIPELLRKKFNYSYLSQLMESIKVTHVAKRIEKHLALGRKVVVFHDFQKGISRHPFDLSDLVPRGGYSDEDSIRAMVELDAEIEAFHKHYPEYAKLPLNNMASVVDTLKRGFGDKVRVINGRVTNKEKMDAKHLFNKDDSGVDILVVQRQAGREGISLHDVTGSHQRALVDLGLPVAPVDAIQTEGRIFRVNLQSDAVLEYPILNVGFERYAFANKVAERSRTAENLAMGNSARDLETAFREGYLNATAAAPGSSQGKGGKEADRRAVETSPFERAKTYYFGRQKNTKRRDQREGVDYFATPEPVGLKMVEWAGLRPDERALEPSAGHGAIARFFPDNTRNVFVEPSRKLADEMSLLVNGDVQAMQFEDLTRSSYDAVIMNPPYGSGGKTAMEHLAIAMSMTKNGGRVVALLPRGGMADKRLEHLLYGKDGELDGLKKKVKSGSIKDSEYKRRKRQVENFHMVADIVLPSVTFKRAGTQVNTHVIVLERQDIKEDAAKLRQTSMEINAEEVNELFDRIEDIAVPERVEPTITDKADTEAASNQNEGKNSNDVGTENVPSDAGHGNETVGDYGLTADDVELIESVHTKKGHDIWTLKMIKRVDRDVYLLLRDKAKELDGYYSSYRGNGAIPGFIFTEEQQANKFRDHLLGTGGDAMYSHTAVSRSPVRTPWGNFPDAVILVPPSEMLKHPDYKKGKAGDIDAAFKVADSLLTDSRLKKIRQIIGDAKPVVVPVLAVESAGNNKLPVAYAAILAEELGGTMSTEIVQTNKVNHGGADGFHRLAHAPLFNGKVEKGKDYLIVDDTLAQGGTLAALRGHIEAEGGRVIMATALSGKQYSAKMNPDPDMIRSVQEKHGDKLDQYWKDEYGYGLEKLTQSELRYLSNARNVEAIRDRISKARHEAGLIAPRRPDSRPTSQKDRTVKPALGGFSASEAQEIIEPIISKWKSGPSVQVIQAETELPDHLQDMSAVEGTGIAGVISGEGAIYIVADNIHDNSHLLRTLAHEAVGHWAFESMLGDKLDGILKSVQMFKKSGNKAVNDIAKQIAENYGDIDAKTEAKEIIAHLAEQGSNISLLQRVIAAVREFLRSMGFTQLTEKDLRALIAKAGRIIESGGNGPGPKGGGKLYSKISKGIEDALAPEIETSRDSLKGRARGVVDWMQEKLEPLATLQDRTSYLTKRYQAMGTIQKYQDAAKDIAETFGKATEAQSKAIYEYLTTKGADADAIGDDALATKARAVKRKIKLVSRLLVEKGFIPQESVDKHQDEYLPRVYLKYLLGDRAVQAIGTGKAASERGYTKARKDIDKGVRDIILGEIKDPGYLAAKAISTPMRDIAILDWMHQIAKHKDWVLPEQFVEWQSEFDKEPRKVTPWWLKSEAARLRTMSRHMPDAQNKAKTLELANQMDEAANAVLDELSSEVPAGYVPVPDNRKYGALRGMIVREEIYHDVVGISHFIPVEASASEKLLGYGGYATKFTQFWKWSKVAANPPAQIRNILSNLVLLNLSGVSWTRIPTLIRRAHQEIHKGGKYYKVAMKYGITESTFAAQEMLHIERDLLALEAKAKGAFSFTYLKLLGAKIMDWAGDKYQYFEGLSKTAKIIDEMERKGTGEAEAVIEAQRWLFDYSLVGKNTRYLRNAPIGAPFLTFQMKVLPRLLEVAVEHPQRYLPYLALFYGAPMLLAAMNDVDDDDVEALQLALPTWLQEKGHGLFLPMKDDLGRWMAVDMGYFMPWSMWTEMGGELSRGEIGGALKTSGLIGGPVPDMITAIKTNRDSFTGKEIVDPADPPAKQVGAMMTYVYGMAMPTWLVGIPMFGVDPTMKGFSGHVYDALSGHVDKYGDPKSTMGQALLRGVGVNLYPIEPTKSRAKNLRYMAFELRDIQKRARDQMRNRNLSQDERLEIIATYTAILEKKQREIREYAEASRVSSKLK